MTDRVGQKLGNYRLTHLLGKGGFAEVYLGQHVRLASKQAAIKILHLFDVDIQKFQQEAEFTEQLVHPHIVRLLDFDLQQGIPFLVLDYAPGGSLRTRHPKGSQIPLATVVQYLKEIAPALQYAHDRHILHRDIKPDNMLIGRQGELLLSDFGIAVLSQTDRTSLQASYGIGGTPFYMAPEVFRGKPTKASDQYALAVVVYEWLCGTVPFSEGNFIQLGYQHTHEPVPPLHDKNSAISPAVEQVVMRALAKQPQQRFESVRVFSDALERACRLQQSTTISPMLEKEVILRHQMEKDFILVTDESQILHVLIEALPTGLMAQVRLPLNIAWILDQSGTMKGAKLKVVKESMKMVIDRLEATDYISVVTFDDTPQIIIPSTPAYDPVGMKSIIDHISIREISTTNRFISRGMIEGLNELKRWNIPNAIRRMILLTDGVTSGDADLCRQLASEAASAGISIYPFGIGADWDEHLLDDIGALSGGMPAEFIRDPMDALGIFEQQVQSAVAAAVCNATLTLRLPAGVSPKKAVKVLPIISDLGRSVLQNRQIAVPLGDLEKDNPQSVLVELMIDPRPAGLFRIAQAELSYNVPIANLIGERIRDDIKVTFTNDAIEAEKVNALVMEYVEKTNAASRITPRPLSHGPEAQT